MNSYHAKLFKQNIHEVELLLLVCFDSFDILPVGDFPCVLRAIKMCAN